MTTPWTETTSRNHRNHQNNSYQQQQQDHEEHHHDPSSGENPAAEGGALPQRKKLQLKPRSATATASSTTPTASASSSSAKSNPFGAAKPREEVLAAKGLDARLMDLRIEQKVQSTTAHHKQHYYTKEQERQLESVRSDLTKLEEELREANENELPEQAILEKLQATKKTLQELTTKFDKEHEATAAAASSTTTTTSTADHPVKEHDAEQPHDPNRPRFERPSQRRRRLDEDNAGATGGHANASHHHHHNQNQNQQQFSRNNNNNSSSGTGNPAVDGEAYSSFSTNRRRRGPDGV